MTDTAERFVTIDATTGRWIGDHSTAQQAIDFALDAHDDTLETYEFLKAWREGDLDEWPEFYAWLAKAESAERALMRRVQAAGEVL